MIDSCTCDLIIDVQLNKLSSNWSIQYFWILFAVVCVQTIRHCTKLKSQWLSIVRRVEILVSHFFCWCRIKTTFHFTIIIFFSLVAGFFFFFICRSPAIQNMFNWDTPLQLFSAWKNACKLDQGLAKIKGIYHWFFVIFILYFTLHKNEKRDRVDDSLKYLTTFFLSCIFNLVYMQDRSSRVGRLFSIKIKETKLDDK